MALIKSISGFRGTIGGKPNENLTPIDIVKFASAYGTWLMSQSTGRIKVVLGRDGRMSGAMVETLVEQSLLSLGIDVVHLGLSTTPTVEMAVVFEKANGGIIITASHNPKEWNALKLLNNKGEFVSAEEGKTILAIAAKEDFNYADIDHMGHLISDNASLENHIKAIINYPLVDIQAIEDAQFSVVVDAINSSGAFTVPALLNAIGVTNIKVLNAEMHGNFEHNPEPLKENLTQLCTTVINNKAHLGIAVDPDVDRLCFVSEDGELFGEEYTLVAIADYILQHKKGATVSNLSSTRALKDVTEKRGGTYFASAVGEVNVVNKMKQEHAVIGGEGNGGIIVPDLHYGRDALIGIALFLTHLAKSKITASTLKASYPVYFMSKKKMELNDSISLENIFAHLEKQFSNYPMNREDGMKIDFKSEWVHLRSSNTEPIIRIYTEAPTQIEADQLADKIISIIQAIQ
ncbi:MAG: phosphoglucosamine mutase [Bacteroidetes bacterium]|nr:phosphoglucosamine mutase [Bacteroidota bacterium]